MCICLSYWHNFTNEQIIISVTEHQLFSCHNCHLSLDLLWNPPTRRLVCAANSLLCSVHLSFSPARPLMRLDAVCILCLQRSASSSSVWWGERADKQVSRLMCPTLSSSNHLILTQPFIVCMSLHIYTNPVKINVWKLHVKCEIPPWASV